MLDHRRRLSLPIHVCEYCTQAFEKKIELENHVEQSHGNEVKTFQCDKCSDSFPLKSFLGLHMDKHKGPNENLCTQCGKVFDYFAGLIAHQKSHSDERPFACDRCPNTFKVKTQLEKHKLSVHAQKRHCYCNICEKYYSCSSALRAHQSKPRVWKEKEKRNLYKAKLSDIK